MPYALRLLCVFFLACSCSAFAQGTVPSEQKTMYFYEQPPVLKSEAIYATYEAACDAYAAYMTSQYNMAYTGVLEPPGPSARKCSLNNSNSYSTVSPRVVKVCNGVPTTSDTCPCPSGTKANPAGDACIPDNACGAKAGTTDTRNFTIGYSRTSGAEQESAWDASVIQRGADLLGTTVCDGSCLGTVSPGSSPKAWQSTKPNSQGLYRLSVDFDVTYTGSTCAASSKSGSLDPAAPSPACDGYLGQINGKTTCVGKVGTADPKYTAPSPIQSGNPAAGSNAADSLPTRTGGSGDAAGGPSSSSDGQIRGGTGSATNGSGGTGSSSSGSTEIKIEMCGSNGNPPCKIDETGTPNGQGAFSGGDAALNGYATSREQGIRGSGDRSSLPWAPSSILLPSLGCEVQTTETRLGSLKLDVCNSPIAQLWRQLMGWLMYMLTVLYCWRLAGGNIGNGGK